MSRAESDMSAGQRPPGRPGKRRRLTLAGLIVIFVSGALVGSALTVIFRPERARRGRRTIEETRDSMTEKIAGRLDLSSEQTERLRKVVEDGLKELRELRREIQPRAERVAGGLREKVAALLDDEQRARWKEFYAELFKRWFPEPASTRPATHQGRSTGEARL